MLDTHKRNILCEYEVDWLRNMDLRAQKPSKLAKIAIFSVRDQYLRTHSAEKINLDMEYVILYYSDRKQSELPPAI